mmetsp:Transcript_2529/g.4455  ORF Transcript_2529/g.4455 Transcript_2529/m.4455 type:complete len:296 (-) Transcript_2529:55-942(-)|eukprot:CAMPEP_0182447996 /NCGR_PEP_ID=MMETSP1172-20130603/22486_1 /TAXON_ID=708627 /ORGANISM="Timspurckia oligopyrenoides, Strain CCMP3278" /LENGTH=295 /DNA_ID=CAMNT_0024644679 /DNA_START=97 /DNA_END=984 /DNA_ORIENTATION=+
MATTPAPIEVNTYKSLLLDSYPPAFFLVDYSYQAVSLSILDCKFDLISADYKKLRDDFMKVSRALDNIATIHKAGWYKVLDKQLDNLCTNEGLPKNLDEEFLFRGPVLSAIDTENAEEVKSSLNAWATHVEMTIKHELEVLTPLTSKLRPEISTDILANGGNDWEWFFGYILQQLESHRKYIEIGTFVLFIQTTTKLGGPVQQQRILPLVEKNVSQLMYGKLKGIGYRGLEKHVEEETPGALLKGVTGIGSPPKATIPQPRAMGSRAGSMGTGGRSISNLLPRIGSRQSSDVGDS